ncbi:MAG: site-specific integrase [Chloroflexi bacterium]|nr:site-specific integrase [Chloroflexota bacterium]
MSKRGNSEGSIYQRKDGRWVASVSLPNGRRKTFYARTRADVARRLQEAQRALQDGLPVTQGRTPLASYLERWLEDSARQTLRPRTFTDYQRIVRLHIAPEIGRTPLARLTAPDIQGLLNRKRASGLSVSRVHAVYAVLSRSLRQAERWSLVSRNVARLVDVPKPLGSKVEPFPPAQLRAFLDSVSGHRLAALFVLAASTGMREGEVLGLAWDAVDLGRGMLQVRASLQRIDGRLQLVEPKTERSRRTIALPAMTMAALRAHKARQLEERLKAGPLWDDDLGLVFTTELGKPIDGGNLLRAYKRLLSKAGLPERRFHDLRHSVATALFAQGVHLRKVADLLGHSQIAVTSEIYTHSIEAGLQEVADTMDAVLAV